MSLTHVQTERLPQGCSWGMEMPPASSGDEMVHLVPHSHGQPQHQPAPQTRAQGAGEILLEGPRPGKAARGPKREMPRISFSVKYNPWAIVDTQAGLGVRLQILQSRPTSMTQNRALHGYGVMETKHQQQGTTLGSQPQWSQPCTKNNYKLTDNHKTCLLLHVSVLGLGPRECWFRA